MGTYLIGDIHGCFDEFQRMLEMIQLSESDRLILIGDYIDRGPDSLSMLRWLERCPPNVTALRGNHEEEFIWYVDLLRTVGWCIVVTTIVMFSAMSFDGINLLDIWSDAIGIIAVGFFILVIAEAFSIGLKLKEEQDLTI